MIAECECVEDDQVDYKARAAPRIRSYSKGALLQALQNTSKCLDSELHWLFHHGHRTKFIIHEL